MSAPLAPGKNIVLLSDGTGNSSAKLMRTNVWRMYEALDVVKGDQVAMYDNGVGTSSFKPFAVLGGAMGWGLKRNVRNLYLFACRNYRPGTDTREADRLYAFGFSRGAFTARVLIGLIEHQGLLAGVEAKDLKRHAKWAYREYRRQFNATRGLVTPLRAIRDVWLRAWERLLGQPAYDPKKNQRVRVSFLGLWDMVDAYGLPIDEMTRGWDEWVWPLSVRAHLPPQNVDKICHAVALDDERHTFHPVLFDERHQPSHTHTDDEAITQVWFAGVHSNVGGGYPDDSLARVPMRWMADEAEKMGLRLHRFICDEWEAHADPNGPANDSRRGLGAYYRYNPRSIQKLTNDRFADVSVPLPKVHESVVRRIVSARDDYAPIVLPEKYAVVVGNGAILGGSEHPLEDATQSQSRCADQERVWNLVWVRRVLYFATIAATLLLIVPPFLFEPSAPPFQLLSPDWRAGASAIALLGQVLPASLTTLIEYYAQNPVHFAVLAAAIGLLMITSSRVQGASGHRMRKLWDTVVATGPRVVTPSTEPTDLVYRLRSSRIYRNICETIAQSIFPFVFGVGALAVLLVVGVATLNRATFALQGASGMICRANAVVADANGSWTTQLSNKSMCLATGIQLESGTRYTVSIELPPGGWFDDTHLVEDAAGFSSTEGGPAFLLGLPFRRVLTSKWFVPMARIGEHWAEYHALDAGSVEIVPRRTGQLFLFVNDAVGLPPWREFFYENNRGGPATVTVVRETALTRGR